MKEKILIFKETGKRADFLKKITKIKDQANELIQLFNEAQPWCRVDTLEYFEKLYADPLKIFDKTLLENIDIKITGGKLPNPAALASLLNIDRPGFMDALGLSEPSKDEDDCPGCKKSAQTIKVGRIKINAVFYQYAEYFLFVNSTLELNNKAIESYCDQFDIYVESDEQLKFYNHWVELCEMLNRHDKIHGISISGKQQTASALRVQLSEGMSGKFVINNMALSEQIKYMK